MEVNNLADVRIPFYDISVPAGFPSPAADYADRYIDLNREFIKNPSSTFMIRCEGDSMSGAYIPDKSFLLIDKSVTPKNYDVILAVVNGGFTVKYFYKTAFTCQLLSANKRFKPIQITEEMDVRVWGVVITIISLPSNNRLCSPL